MENIIGKRFIVIDDDSNFFESGEVVIPLENNRCPFCVREEDYEEGKLPHQYRPEQYNPLYDTEIIEIKERLGIKNESDKGCKM